MDGQARQVSELQAAVQAAMAQLNIADKAAELNTLQAQSQRPDFWSDTETAQRIMKQLAGLDTQVRPWQQLDQDVYDLAELTALDDADMSSELEAQIAKAQAAFDELKAALRFTGPFDDHNAILTIYAGAGGTDAQDWAQMLLRMYLRWAEQHGYKTEMIDESAGDEAGIKSATLEISGSQAYGKLQGEHGVHRLVRQSPFNSAASRETSFAKVDVLPEIDQPDDIELDDKDLKIDVYRSGGHGGQSVNTTDSAVRVTHLPTGIAVAIQNERSQLQNKETALTILRSRLAQLQLEQHTEKISELKGPSSANEFGSQIRNYVLHPYKQVKDLRSGYETSDPDTVLNGNLDPLIDAYLEHSLGE